MRAYSLHNMDGAVHMAHSHFLISSSCFPDFAGRELVKRADTDPSHASSKPEPGGACQGVMLMQGMSAGSLCYHKTRGRISV